ncbi:Cytidylate kinase [Planctomycetes bacterium CA13]|uniref:Cytidylate kinase n=1 Tax=Novipirellula herctigrandis TaxID=2527986 RepID=A0A5C5ZE66_9BACT|nr:Cytidylate kinase [Planctomycetes bacterium CA13]
MIVAIDGPAGAGKSSIARLAAKQLKYEFLDTGALYRAVTLAAIRAQIDFSDVGRLVELAENAKIDWDGEHVFLNGDNVSVEIRTPTVTDAIRYLADQPKVRSRLSEQQRRIAEGRNIVTEGRDQGCEVFPEAECKIFLTASPEERAQRRYEQLKSEGRHIPVHEILIAQNKRDLEDRMRPVGRLRAAEDAVILNTDGMSPQDVLETVVKIARERIETSSEAT